MTPAQYHSLRARPDMSIAELGEANVTKSLLADFAPSPWAWRNGPRKETTKSMEWGSLVDAVLCGTVEDEFAVLPEDAPPRPTDKMIEEVSK